MDNRHLSKLAYKEEFVENTSPHHTAAYIEVSEDASTELTHKLEFGKMSNEILTRLMQEVEHKLDDLLSMLANNHNEIEKLQNENKQLKDNYTKILDQINIYVKELEEIKKLQK